MRSYVVTVTTDRRQRLRKTVQATSGCAACSAVWHMAETAGHKPIAVKASPRQTH